MSRACQTEAALSRSHLRQSHRRRALIEAPESSEAHDVILVEDDPYGCLAFDGDAPPSMLALSRGNDALHDRIIYLGSLSKTVAPGLRIGWMAAHPDVIRRAVIAKQASDLCTPPWIQAAMAVYLQSGYLDAQIGRIVSAYRVKRDAMVKALNQQLGGSLTFCAPNRPLKYLQRTSARRLAEALL
ncbi:aminotransferase class I/II-fold pyridoxal phosphate-dependent enzyme [Cupriavidus necator]